MRRLLSGFAAATTRYPVAVLATIAVLTGVFAAFASTLHLEVDLTQFGREDSAAVQTMDRVRDEFGDPTAAVQVIVDAGPGGDVLTADGLVATAAAEQIALDALGTDARPAGDGMPPVLSLGAAVRGALDRQGVDPATVEDAQVGAIASQALAANPQLAALVSRDTDLDRGTARATVVVALLDPALDDNQRAVAAERVEAAFAEREDVAPALADVDVTVLSSGLFVSGLLDAVRAEVPRLFGLALLVVLTILAFAYRSLFDVAVGSAGLVATVAWTFGTVALLGPGFLGWRGPLSQLGVIVPVLLVGLGIDYSVHLTARYREQRAAGQTAVAAAGGALHTVGAALVLATVATAVGFAASATAPLQMIADFGVFVAVGVVWAFVVMALLVPSARVLRDRRRDRTRPAAVRELGLAGLMRGPIAAAQRAPVAGLVVALLLAGASLVAATGLVTEFDRDDFVPEGSEVAERLALQGELFGGGVAEVTFVVIDGDVEAPAVADAIDDAQRHVATVEGVRAVGAEPQVRPDGGAAVVQVRTVVGDAGAEQMYREVVSAFAPVEDAGARIQVTSEPIIIGEMSEDLSAFQVRAIGVTLALVLVLLVGYYALVHRRPLLGVVAMIPAVVSASLILGAMWLLGISFNILSATLTAIAVGIGVPYGVHVVNRFVEDRAGDGSVDDAVARTLQRTGGALAGSALTTLGAFVVLSFSGLVPIQQLGRLGGTGIAVALLAALLVEPGALVLWARHHERRRPA